jgi:hypothetical protein
VSYATASDVQIYLPPGYTIGVSAGVPSVAQVTEFLTHTSNQIDSALASRGLQVPVTTPAWFLTDLTRLNAQGAAALTLQQIFPLLVSQTPASTGAGANNMAADLQRRFDAQLTQWKEKGLGLPVAVSTQENDLAPRSYLTDLGADQQPDATVTDAIGNPVYAQPLFTVGQVF